MQNLTDEDILYLWESNIDSHPMDKALAILSRALPEFNRDQLAYLTQGKRDNLLLQVRQSTFGDLLQTFAQCPGCGRVAEFSLSCERLCRCSSVIMDIARAISENDEGRVSARLNNGKGLERVGLYQYKNKFEETNVIYHKRVYKTNSGLAQSVAQPLSYDIEFSLNQSLANADPLPELILTLNCPDCNCQWQAALDVIDMLWKEIVRAATQVIQEVHELALAYGWREQDVLALTSMRRAAYLKLIALRASYIC